MGILRRAIGKVGDRIKKKMAEEQELRDIERKAFLEERKEAVKERGKKKARDNPYKQMFG